MKHVALAILVVLGWGCASVWAQGTKADYDRMNRLAKGPQAGVFHAAVNAHWAADGNSFWYETRGPHDARQTWVVDCLSGNRRAAKDDEKAAFKTAALPNIHRPHRSPNGNGETTITFVNHTDQTVSVYWINNTGEREPYPEVKAGKEREQHTMVGHVWAGRRCRQRDAGRLRSGRRGRRGGHWWVGPGDDDHGDQPTRHGTRARQRRRSPPATPGTHGWRFPRWQVGRLGTGQQRRSAQPRCRWSRSADQRWDQRQQLRRDHHQLVARLGPLRRPANAGWRPPHRV